MSIYKLNFLFINCEVHTHGFTTFRPFSERLKNSLSMDGVFRFSYNWPLPGVYFFSVTVHTTQIGNGIIIAFNYAMCTIFSPLYYYTIIQFHFKASMRFNFTFVLVLQLYFSRITAAAYTIVLYIRNCFRFVIILFVMISTLNSFSQISFHRGAGWGDTGRRKGSYDK